MSQFELIPKGDVLAVQTGIFLVAIVIIKKLMLDPYVQLREKRLNLTTGSQADAKQALAKAKTLSETITSQINDAAQQGRDAKEAVRETAIEKRNSIVAAADTEAKATIASVIARIQAEIEEEKSKIPATVAALTNEVYSIALR